MFVRPSPAITDAETALLYPGMGLLEGININEGRGTRDPFKIFGAPWVNADEIQKEFRNLKLPGVIAYPYSYELMSGVYCNEKCYGLRFKISDVSSFRPVRLGLELIRLMVSLYPEYCKQRLYKTRANPTGQMHLDKLTGIYNSFEKIKNAKITDLYEDMAGWKKSIRPYLLY